MKNQIKGAKIGQIYEGEQNRETKSALKNDELYQECDKQQEEEGEEEENDE